MQLIEQQQDAFHLIRFRGGLNEARDQMLSRGRPQLLRQFGNQLFMGIRYLHPQSNSTKFAGSSEL